MRRIAVGLLVLLSAACLLLSSTSLWVRHHVVNTQVFVSTTETMLHDPAVQARVTAGVTTQVMANPDVQRTVDSAMSALPEGLQRFRPTVEDGIRSLVATGVRRLLTSAAFGNLTSAALTSAHTQLVNGEPVRFTLGQAKNFVPPDNRDGLAGQVLALVPDNIGITILTPADAPRLYNAIDLLKVVWLWVGLISLGLLAGALGVSRRRRRTLRAWSVTLTVLVLMVLATLRLVYGPLIAQVKPVNRNAVSAIWDVVAGSLRAWNLWLLGIALLVLTLTLVWGRLGVVAGVRRGVQAARAQLRKGREARAAAQTATAQAALTGTAGGPAADGAPAPVAAQEPWYRRAAAAAGAFGEGFELDRRVAGLSVLVRARLRPARWTGIVLGALVLLFWPAPTLSVLIWIVAIVALYLGALEWLQGRAPAAAVAEAPPVAAPAGRQELRAAPAAPQPRAPANHQVDAALAGAGIRAAVPAVVVPALDEPGRPVPEEPRPVPPERLIDLSQRLELAVRLGAARDAGVLTEDEFAREKARILVS